MSIELIVILGTSTFLILSVLFVFLAFKFREKIVANQNEFYKSLIQCEISERQRIAKEIHDGIGGLLGMAKFHLSNIDELEKLNPAHANEIMNAIKLIDLANDEARNISNELLPASIIRYGLKGAIEDLVKIYKPNFEIVLFFDCQEEISSQLQANLYRIVNELLNNTRKHAKAAKVEIDFIAGLGKVMLHFSDDGNGFDFYDKTNNDQGNGLRNIENRVKLFNGKLSYMNNQGSIYNFEFQL